MSDFATSADGTRVAFQTLGAGQPILIVHGGLGCSTGWASAARLLARHRQVVLFDRRGRGRSGDGEAPHALKREVEDVEALLRLTGPDTAVVGHSFGGAVAAEAALRNDVSALVLYEPAIGIGGAIQEADIGRMDALIAADERDAALEVGIAALDAADLVAAGPRGPRPEAVLAVAPTVPRELRAVTDPGLDIGRYAAVATPVLVLAGMNSPPRMRLNCERLATAIPSATLHWLEGLGHVAHTAAPDVVAGAVLEFLADAENVTLR
jgi:pimeloyl-ACP methyl ester carboxylesterase